MHHGDKADLVNVIVTDKHRYSKHPDVTCIVIDGAAMVRTNKPRNSTTIGEYIDHELMPKIMHKFTCSDRVDLVFDQYKPDSIKSGARIGRGDTGKRRKVGLNVKIPGNWKEFLSCSKNKTELNSH